MCVCVCERERGGEGKEGVSEGGVVSARMVTVPLSELGCQVRVCQHKKMCLS